jgi:transcriptional regulator with XRE-family HTH domain
MNPKQQTALAKRIRTLRTERDMSQAELGRQAGVASSTIVRIEQGAFASVSPDVLRSIAEALKIPAFELFELADIAVPNDLPQFTPYMRAKYRDLTPADVVAIETYAAKIAKRRGVSLTGPKPGEDE